MTYRFWQPKHGDINKPCAYYKSDKKIKLKEFSEKNQIKIELQ
jgi:hypothetical protein